MKNWKENDIKGKVIVGSDFRGAAVLRGTPHPEKKEITKMAITKDGGATAVGFDQYTFHCVPMGKPRMTQRDRWYMNPDHSDPKKRQRTAITKYNAWKNVIQSQANMMNFELSDRFEITFYMPMPKQWGQAKREKMEGEPHQQKPDGDNILKAVQDCLKKSDQSVYDVHMRKFWSANPRIIIIQ